LLEQIRDAISAERLTSYLRICAGELEPALNLYRWNHDIAGALLRPLCDLEVTLRNAIHRRLTVIAGPDPWWTAPELLADDRAAQDLVRAERSLQRGGKAVTPGGMVAELSFGFWVALIGNRFDMSLWRRGLYLAFPHYRGPRKQLHLDLQQMLGLRNRIGHHEPIHHRHLAADRQTVHRLLGYLSSDMQRWGQADDRFPDLLACRPSGRRRPAARPRQRDGRPEVSGR
jgi:hypothetical protein